MTSDTDDGETNHGSPGVHALFDSGIEKTNEITGRRLASTRRAAMAQLATTLVLYLRLMAAPRRGEIVREFGEKLWAVVLREAGPSSNFAMFRDSLDDAGRTIFKPAISLPLEKEPTACWEIIRESQLWLVVKFLHISPGMTKNELISAGATTDHVWKNTDLRARGSKYFVCRGKRYFLTPAGLEFSTRRWF